MYRTDFGTLWKKARVGCSERTALKHVYYLGWNRSPAQVVCMTQVFRAGALWRPRGIGWRRKWEGWLGCGTHVNPWLIHVNVWQKPLQYCKVISFQLIKINGRKTQSECALKPSMFEFYFLGRMKSWVFFFLIEGNDQGECLWKRIWWREKSKVHEGPDLDLASSWTGMRGQPGNMLWVHICHHCRYCVGWPESMQFITEALLPKHIQAPKKLGTGLLMAFVDLKSSGSVWLFRYWQWHFRRIFSPLTVYVPFVFGGYNL